MPNEDADSGQDRQITQLSIGQLTRLVLSRDLSAEEVARAHLRVVAERNPDLNALVHVDADHALASGSPS